MSQYVNLVTIEVNGQSFSDFSGYTDNSVTVAKQVPLMNKTGHALMTPRYGFTLETKTPIPDTPIDLDNVRNGTVTVQDDGGGRITYGGVYTLETGDGSSDGETEITRTKVFSAETKVKE